MITGQPSGTNKLGGVVGGEIKKLWEAVRSQRLTSAPNMSIKRSPNGTSLRLAPAAEASSSTWNVLPMTINAEYDAVLKCEDASGITYWVSKPWNCILSAGMTATGSSQGGELNDPWPQPLNPDSPSTPAKPRVWPEFYPTTSTPEVLRTIMAIKVTATTALPDATTATWLSDVTPTVPTLTAAGVNWLDLNTMGRAPVFMVPATVDDVRYTGYFYGQGLPAYGGP